MKFIKFSAILLISLHIYAIPDFNEKSSVKLILEKCSSSEVKTITSLYVGRDLNKRCLVKEFNKVFKVVRKLATKKVTNYIATTWIQQQLDMKKILGQK